jgi:hypothetical protein
MPKFISEWTEDDVLALPKEGTLIERKGAASLDLALPGTDENKVLNEMAKQVSAFANSGGGKLIYGVNDNGLIDNGGVTQIFKGRQNTKEWIEDILPNLTESEVLGINVYEISRKAEGASALAPGKALYILDVPDSERAPHQSQRDSLYYVRIGSKSRPATHRILEDIRNRARFPLVRPKFEILKVEIPFTQHQGINGESRVHFGITLINYGKLKSTNTCLRTEVSLPSARFQSWDQSVVNRRNTSQSEGIVFWEFLYPLYPGMENTFLITMLIPLKLVPGQRGWCAGQTGVEVRGVSIGWTLFADNSPASSGTILISEDLNFEEKARFAILMHQSKELIYQYYGGPTVLP